MKTKKGRKIYIIITIAVLILIAIFIIFRFVFGGGEDSWIKDERGIYVKHGNPSETPAEVAWQQAAIICAYKLFNNMTLEKNSQCLGTCMSYAVDIVHVPRNGEDDLAENQCSDYGKGIVTHFIELDKDREIVRII